MATTLDIRLKKASKIYHEGELVSGVVAVTSPADIKHDGLTLQMEGSVDLQLSNKNVGILEAFYNSVKPITLVSQSVELAPPGRIPAGVTEIPFEVPLRARQTATPQYPGLLETYHGVFVSVLYVLRCSMKRSFLNKPLNTSCQFVVQYPQAERPAARPARCVVEPASLRGGRVGAVPHFRIEIELDTTVCALDRPFTGHICVKECSVPIKSIELQLVRVETCGCSEGYSRDASEIQNIQLGEGDVCRGLRLPVYMVLPRLFTCPTTTTLNFKIEFEVNIAIIFHDDHLVTENFPILLVRSR